MGNLYFDSKTEGRKSCYVEYRPPISNNRFATVHVTFPNIETPEEIAKICIFELEHWLTKFGVPVMLTAWNSNEDIIDQLEPYASRHLVGWIEKSSSNIRISGNHHDLDEYLKNQSASMDWIKIYPDFNYRNQAQVTENAQSHLLTRSRQTRVLKIILTAWLVAIPASWAILQYFGPNWLGIFVTLFALYRATKEGLKIWGRLKPSIREQRETEDERVMKHHHYHCVQNLEGFLKLRSENFARETKASIQQEAERLGIKTDNRT